MFELKPLSVAVQRALSTAAIAATVVAPTMGYAQEEAKDKGVVEGVVGGVGEVVKGVVSIPGKVIEGIFGKKDRDSIEEVVITGSRISTDVNLTSSSPVTMITAEELGHRGITRVEDLLNDLPSITPEFTANESNGATGTATIDLRGLTSDRTLVLTNGHRMGLGDVFQLAPDINQVPGQLIERIEVLTGGASSTYGSDAMSGVVNFVMKRDFEGIEIDYQYSGNQHNSGNPKGSGTIPVATALSDAGFDNADSNVFDGGGHDVNLTMGVNSSDGKGNITAYLGYRQTNAALQGDRDFSACALNSGGTGDNCAGSITLPTGLITDFAGTYFTVAGDQFVPWDYSYYNYAPLNHFQRPDERFTAGLFGHYEVNEHFEAYTEFQFMDDRSNAQIAPSGAFFVTTSLNCDNPLLSAQQSGAIGCTAGEIASGATKTIYLGRRNVEGGPRNDDLQHTSFRMLAGAKGEINDDWSYDAFINVSRTDYNELYNEDFSTTRVTRALDVIAGPGGVPTCRSVINGSDPNCVPYNIFSTGGVTAEQIAYLDLPLFSEARLKEDQIVAFVSGDLTSMGMVSPMAEDGAQIVLGGEYRDARMDYVVDLAYQSGDGAGQGGATAPVEGGVDVKEFFVEAQIPLVQNQPWIESLTLDAGYRYSDYSTDDTTNTYKFNGEYTPVSGYKFRGGYSRASRVANIRELFEPSTLGLWSGTDPCANGAPATPGGPPTAPIQSAAQCANSGVTAAQYGNIPRNPAGQYNGQFGGNTELTPEKSNSFSIGAVFTPSNVPGLQLSVDYWSIEIKDAIDDVDPSFIVTQCGETGDPVFCDLVSRNAANGNLWIGSQATSPRVFSTNVNIGFFKTSGIDIATSYALEAGDYGSVDFSFRGTWLNEFKQQLAPGSPIEECGGFYGGSCQRARPEWRHTLTSVWSTPWGITGVASWRYIGGVDEFEQDRYSSGTENYLDLSASYTTSLFGLGETTLNIGVSNVLDNDPPVSGFFNNVSVFGNGNTIPGLWDSQGRYMFFGLTQKF
ncbi:MAG: iron complex outermembrane receptor protein [Planctomycetota bacterium]|jgi:iron complex outermembrane receptor protein